MTRQLFRDANITNSTVAPLMTRKSSQNPKFHFEIWKGPSSQFGAEPKAIYYVENHNAQCGYAELALDFEMAATELITRYRSSGLANWMAPVAHLVRQTLELKLKALLTAVSEHDQRIDATSLGRHDLMKLWQTSRGWLVSKKYKILEDARLEPAEHLILAFHEIDPNGDLFRFAISRQTAFNKHKSYDRVGLNLGVLSTEFEAAVGLLGHWEGTLIREIIAQEMKWETDPYFDPDDFPRKRIV